MSERTLRFGVLGCASIAIRAVIPGIQQSERCDVVAIASRDEAKAKQTAEKLNIPVAYGSYETLLADDSIDAVYIPLPNHLHYPWTVRAAQAGKHVLCEKPIALTADEATAMVSACEEAGVQLSEAFMYRYHPRYARIQAIIASGEIGELRGIHSTFTFNNAGSQGNVRFDKSMGGGAIYDVGCYPISVARLIYGREPEAATVQAFFSPEHDHVDMMASGLVEFPGHVALTFDCAMWADFRNTLEILGTNGRIEVPNAFIGDPDFDVIVKGERRRETVERLNTYALQADAFARAVLDGEQPQFAPLDAVQNMRVIDACLTSGRDRERITLSSQR